MDRRSLIILLKYESSALSEILDVYSEGFYNLDLIEERIELLKSFANKLHILDEDMNI
jgi:hypothetical protein